VRFRKALTLPFLAAVLLEVGMKEQFYILELDEEFIVISITDRGTKVVKRGYNSRQEALGAFPQAA
jgi:hypothetical protein